MKKNFKQTLLSSLIGLSMLGFAGSAFASGGTASTTLSTTMTVSGSCGFTGTPTALAFTAMTNTNNSFTQSATLSYNCSTGYTPTLTSFDTLNDNMVINGVNDMSDTFNVQAFADSALTTDLGATSYTGLALTADGTTHTQTVYIQYSIAKGYWKGSTYNIGVPFYITY